MLKITAVAALVALMAGCATSPVQIKNAVAVPLKGFLHTRKTCQAQARCR